MYTLEGISSVANFITAYKTETPIFLSVVCSLFPKAIFSTFILLHCSWYKCHVAAVERLPVLYHSADYISFFWHHWAHCGIFENGVLLM